MTKENAIVLDFSSQLKTATKVYHSTQSGDPLVHLGSDSLFGRSYMAMSLGYGRPWVVNTILLISFLKIEKHFFKNQARLWSLWTLRILDSGLNLHWQYSAYRRLRAEAREAGQVQQQEASLNGACESGSSCPLGMGHLYGTYAILGVGFAASVLGQLVELFVHKREKKKSDGKKEKA